MKVRILHLVSPVLRIYKYNDRWCVLLVILLLEACTLLDAVIITN